MRRLLSLSIVILLQFWQLLKIKKLDWPKGYHYFGPSISQEKYILEEVVLYGLLFVVYNYKLLF